MRSSTTLVGHKATAPGKTFAESKRDVSHPVNSKNTHSTTYAQVACDCPTTSDERSSGGSIFWCSAPAAVLLAASAVLHRVAGLKVVLALLNDLTLFLHQIYIWVSLPSLAGSEDYVGNVSSPHKAFTADTRLLGEEQNQVPHL
jgi:hypothetical protein